MTLLLTGCGKEELSTEIVKQNPQEINSLELIQNDIYEALSKNENLNYIVNAQIDQLPDDININQIPKTESEKVTGLYAFNQTAFMFANHVNEKDTWSGVLAKKKGNGGWIKLFTNPQEEYRQESMYAKDDKLYIDLINDEKNILSFSTIDGKSWVEETN